MCCGFMVVVWVVLGAVGLGVGDTTLLIVGAAGLGDFVLGATLMFFCRAKHADGDASTAV